MHHVRYGNLAALAAKTDGACHLCHEPADLTFYGRTGAYGDLTTTVDHIVPQRFGGGDEPENLLIAHGVCNSRRGTRDVERVRLELAGTTAAPMSASTKNAVSLASSSLLALVAGHAFAQTTEAGERQFNPGAAVLTGVLSAVVLRALLQPAR